MQLWLSGADMRAYRSRSISGFEFAMAMRDMKNDEKRTNPFPKAPDVTCRVVTQAEVDASYERIIEVLERALNEPESDEDEFGGAA